MAGVTMKRHVVALLIGVATIASGCSPSGSMARGRRDQPNLILYGGKVFTADSANPWASAVSIRDERILAVGSDEAILRAVGPETRLIDLGGRVVIPGINDTHTHLGYSAPLGGIIRAEGDWAAGPDPQHVLDSLGALVRRTPSSTWLRGQMALRIRSDPSFRRTALDRIAPDHPVILVGSYGHGTLVNTRALRMLGISDTMPDPPGGWYERVPGTRVITGLLDGSAQYGAWDAYFSSSPEGMVAELRRNAAEALRLGVTTVQQMSSPLNAGAAERLFRAAALPVRVRVIQWPHPGRLSEWTRIEERRPSALSYISGVKYVVDGTPIEQWALMHRPYEGRPDWHGRPYYSTDAIRGFLRDALTGEDQLMLHIVGDSTTAVVFGLMRELAPDSAWRRLRVRIEHASGVTGANMERARHLGAVLSQARADATQIHAWQRAGLAIAHGSDGEPGNPFHDLMWQTTAQHESEALSREDAVRAYTRGSAYAEFAEHDKGTLAPGMLADLAVLSQDIFTVPADALPGTTSVLTLVGGKVAHDSGVIKAEVRK